MNPRASLLLFAAAAVVAVVAADVSLWRVFAGEKAAALAAASDQRRLIVDAVRGEVRDHIDGAMSDFDARARRIEADRLAPDNGLVLVDDGGVVLPRAQRPLAPAPSLAERLLDDAGAAADGVDTSELDAELANALVLVRTVRATQGTALEDAVRRFLRVRAENRWTSATSAALSLLVVEALAHNGDVDRQLLRALLIEGMDVGDASHITPIASDVLVARDKGELSARGLVDMHDRLLADCAAVGVECAAFSARWAETYAAADVDQIASGLASVVRVRDDGGNSRAERRVLLADPAAPPASLAAHAVFLERTGDASARGAVLDESALSSSIATELRARLLLAADDTLHLGLAADVGRVAADGGRRMPGRVALALDDVDVVLATPRLDAAANDAAVRFRVKSGLLAAMNLMALALGAAVVVDARRRRRYDELRAGFIAAVSHELRTPLASMRLLIESMLPRADDKASVKLERLGKDVDGLDFLVENILSFSRLERGRLEINRERVSLAEVVADAVARARTGGDGGAVISVDADDDVVVAGDPELLGIVVANLARNAWHHNPAADKRVSIRVVKSASPSSSVPSSSSSAPGSSRGSSASSGARVIVEDNGPGVPAADRERIFREFERGERAPSRGTGLGLALCRQIARAHGGDVVLAKTGPGGSTFELMLP